MSILLLTLMLLASLIGLVVSGRITITSLTRVATAFGVSEFTVAFIILAMATSMPELFVAISSAIHHEYSIVLSTILGSNIANITLITGLTAIFSGGIATDKLDLRRDIVTSGAVTLLPLLFMINGVISRVEGVILLIVFGWYVSHLLRDQSQYSHERLPRHIIRGVLSILVAFAMIALLIFSANTTVDSAVELATIVGIPTFLIGLFLLSVGTSLPELITTLQSNRNGSGSMALGNILGSNIANSSLILGIASLISPITTDLYPSLGITMVFVFLSVIVVSIFAARGGRISIRQGFLLTVLFFLFGLVILGAEFIWP